MSQSDLLAAFVFFFAVIDPIGTVPVFLAVTQRFDAAEKRRIALKATLAVALVLLFFVVAGEVLLKAITIPLAAFQIAGGIVLFLFALTMIFGESKPDEEMKLARSTTEAAIFPLAVPSMASPGHDHGVGRGNQRTRGHGRGTATVFQLGSTYGVMHFMLREVHTVGFILADL